MTYRTYLSVGLRALAVVACLSLASYASQASAAIVYGLDDQSNLFTFDHLTPGNITGGVFLSGLQPNERLVGIDFRPNNPTPPGNPILYGIGSTFRVYTVDPATGICSAVSGAPFTSPAPPGNSFGMDFNPVADRLRFVSDADDSFRVNQLTGALAATDFDLAYPGGSPNPNVVGVAYTNSIPSAPSTTLYGIDSNANTLVRIGSVNGAPNLPDTGILTTIGNLGVDADNFVGFDISTSGGTDFAIASFASGGNSSLYSVNLTTGATFNFGQIIGGVRVVDIALTPGQVFNLPEPSTIVMLVLGGLGMCAIRRRKAAK